MPAQKGLGTDDGKVLEDRREPSIQLDEKPAVGIGQLGAPANLAPQDDQLLSERCALRFKSASRLDGRRHDGHQ